MKTFKLILKANAGVIAGIVVGAIVAVAAIGIVGFIVFKHYQKTGKNWLKIKF